MRFKFKRLIVATGQQSSIPILIVTLSMLACGCGGDKDYSAWMDELKQRCKASDLKTVVAPLLSVYDPKDQRSMEVPLDQLPNEIIHLYSFEPSWASVLANGKPENRTLWITWGSGFYHYGLLICPFGGKALIHQVKGTVTPWEEGVYFYKDY